MLVKMFRWLIDNVNSIGQPKKSNTVQSTEVISAIKVKNNQNPINSAASTTFVDTKIKQSNVDKSGTPVKSNKFANNSTSARGYYPQYAIGTFEKITENFDQDVLDKIDDDLEQLLSGASNIKPVDIFDINNKYWSKKSKKFKKIKYGKIK